jgi:hypothetical protein
LRANASGSDSSVSVAQSPGSGVAAASGAVQQRITLQLRFDECGQLGVGHLQQLDRLQQLRRQHHRLALPHCQSVRQRHPQPPLFDCRPRSPPRRGVLFAYSTRWRAKRQALSTSQASAPV